MHDWDCDCNACQHERECWAARQPPLIDELDDRDGEDHDIFDYEDPHQDEIDDQRNIDDNCWDRNQPIDPYDDFYDCFYKP